MDNTELLSKNDLIENKEVHSVEELTNEILQIEQLKGYVFRGHGDSNYQLRPTLLRDNMLQKYKTQGELCLNELRGLIMFFREANNHGLYVPDIPQFCHNYFSNYFDLGDGIKDEKYYWLGDDVTRLAILAQHYGMKTRLLDWTTDIRIALYFACSDKTVSNGNAAIWCIDAQWLQEYKRRCINATERIAVAGAKQNPDNHSERRTLIEMTHDDSIPLQFFISSYADNKNLNAQHGLLSMWRHNIVKSVNRNISDDLIAMRESMNSSLKEFFDSPICDDRKSLDELILEYFNEAEHRIKVYRMRGKPLFRMLQFDAGLKDAFLNVLRLEGYDEAKVYPGYRSVAKMVNENLKWI